MKNAFETTRKSQTFPLKLHISSFFSRINQFVALYNRPVRKSVISSQVSQFSQVKALRKLIPSKLMIRKLKFPNISNASIYIKKMLNCCFFSARLRNSRYCRRKNVLLAEKVPAHCGFHKISLFLGYSISFLYGMPCVICYLILTDTLFGSGSDSFQT